MIKRPKVDRREFLIHTHLLNNEFLQIDDFIKLESIKYVYDKMPQKMQDVIDLRSQGYSVSQVARSLKITENYVRVLMTRAKKRMFYALF